jgi:TolA-binding protein
MKTIGNVFLILIILFTGSCSSPEKQLSDKIETEEKGLYKDSSLVPDPQKAKTVIALYDQYVEKFPRDTASAGYLFKAGDISSKTNNVSEAIRYFDRLIDNYPQHEKAPYALFLQGFIFENQLGDPVKAKPYYEEFLKKYPDHSLARDVNFSLENLGRSPEELIRDFEMKNDSLASQKI